MLDEFVKPRRRWPKKFRDALQGAAQGARRQSSFLVHFACAGLVILLAGVVRVNLTEWCLLVLCISTVLASEMFNSALETLAKAIDTRFNPHLADGLNIASAAVLLTATGAVVIGLLVFGGRFAQHFS